MGPAAAKFLMPWFEIWQQKHGKDRAKGASPMQCNRATICLLLSCIVALSLLLVWCFSLISSLWMPQTKSEKGGPKSLQDAIMFEDKKRGGAIDCQKHYALWAPKDETLWIEQDGELSRAGRILTVLRNISQFGVTYRKNLRGELRLVPSLGCHMNMAKWL